MLSQLKRLFTALLVSLLLVLPASAEQSERFGDFVIHYNILSTDMLEPAIAREYDIKRSKSRAMLNISVIQKKPDGSGNSVKADVTVTSSSLTGHKETLNMREIRDGEAIYYISDFPVAHRDTKHFELRVRPEQNKDIYTVKFKEQFFTE